MLRCVLLGVSQTVKSYSMGTARALSRLACSNALGHGPQPKSLTWVGYGCPLLLDWLEARAIGRMVLPGKGESPGVGWKGPKSGEHWALCTARRHQMGSITFGVVRINARKCTA